MADHSMSDEEDTGYDMRALYTHVQMTSNSQYAVSLKFC